MSSNVPKNLLDNGRILMVLSSLFHQNMTIGFTGEPVGLVSFNGPIFNKNCHFFVGTIDIIGSFQRLIYLL